MKNIINLLFIRWLSFISKNLFFKNLINWNIKLFFKKNWKIFNLRNMKKWKNKINIYRITTCYIHNIILIFSKYVKIYLRSEIKIFTSKFFGKSPTFFRRILRISGDFPKNSEDFPNFGNPLFGKSHSQKKMEHQLEYH